MRDRLRGYVESLFIDAPRTKKTVELKEEILQNLYDKYDDLLREGKTEEAAYNIAVAGVGDISPLLEELERSERAYDAQNPYPEARKRSAIMVAAAVAMYILAVIPCLIWEEGGVIPMFIVIALATALLIYNGMTRPRYISRDDTVVENFKEWKTHNSNRHQVYKALSSALWSITVVVYFLVSFGMGAWHISWVIFLISSAINSVLRAIFDLGR